MASVLFRLFRRTDDHLRAVPKSATSCIVQSPFGALSFELLSNTIEESEKIVSSFLLCRFWRTTSTPEKGKARKHDGGTEFSQRVPKSCGGPMR